jgi:bacterioferritin-associated ferredoxin
MNQSAVCTPSDCCASAVASLRPLCHCLRVYEEEIRQVIDEGQLETVKQVTQTCGAGGGCTACHRHIKRLLKEAAELACG